MSNHDTPVTKRQRALEVMARRAFEYEDARRETEEIAAQDLVRLTKELVLQGHAHRERIYVEQMQVYVTLRPLTDAEYLAIRRLAVQGVNPKSAGQIGSKIIIAGETSDQILERNKRSQYHAVALSLSCDDQDWTVDDVRALPPGVPDYLYGYVALISGFPQ